MIVLIIIIVAVILAFLIWKSIIYFNTKKRNGNQNNIGNIISLEIAKALSSEGQSKYIQQRSAEIIDLEEKKRQLALDVKTLSTECDRLKRLIEETMSITLSKRNKKDRFLYFVLGIISSIIAYYLVNILSRVYQLIINSIYRGR